MKPSVHPWFPWIQESKIITGAAGECCWEPSGESLPSCSLLRAAAVGLNQGLPHGNAELWPDLLVYPLCTESDFHMKSGFLMLATKFDFVKIQLKIINTGQIQEEHSQDPSIENRDWKHHLSTEQRTQELPEAKGSRRAVG